MEDALKIIGMLTSKWMADPVLLALLPVVVEEGLDELPVQEYLPLIALLLSSFWNAEQSNGAELDILKTPLTWVNAGRSTLEMSESSGLIDSTGEYKYVLWEISDEIKSTSNHPEVRKSVDHTQSGVVGYQKGFVDRSYRWEGRIG